MNPNASPALTSEERQRFFDENGYWPDMKFVEPKPRQQKAKRAGNAVGLMQGARNRFVAHWKWPLHWQESPAFENPGRMYQELGHEEFLRQVTDYYQGIAQGHLGSARTQHTKWAIRQILRNFEAAVRGFRGQAVSRGSQYARGGRVFATASDVLTLPETLVQDGRLLGELDAQLRAYGVPEQDRPVAAELVRMDLRKRWGVKL